MQTYSEFRPSQYDVKGLGLEDRQDWLVPDVFQNRDSPFWQEANFEAFKRELERIDPEHTDWELHRFGHWGNGWFELFIVRAGSEAAKKAEKMADALSDYPILDEHLHSEYEEQAKQAYWKNMSLKERVRLIGNRNQIGQRYLSIMAARRDEYPSELCEWLSDRVHENG
jgi:hypothetical protein